VRGRKGVARGGESRAWALLDSFLGERGARYPRDTANPLTAFQSSSRLSPYIAWGCISARTVFQRTAAARRALAEHGHRSALGVPFAEGALESFGARLRRRCDHMQRLESAPAIEHRCIDAACEALRAEDRLERTEAWMNARTGYPLVDACMRALQAGGWLHFRGRALVAAFAVNQLWIDWRRIRDFLARQFLDYEPGVHCMELQVASGTAGRRAPKAWDVVRESRQLDADGEFIRAWLPELAALPRELVHEPWKMSVAQQAVASCRLGRDYPRPIVDQGESLASARLRLRQLDKLEVPESESGDAIPQDEGGQRSFTWVAPASPPPADSP
jgi:deoxyribodipyrimidine photo-lyase